MYKLFILLLLVFIGIPASASTTIPDKLILNIDNPIVYFDMIVYTPCLPYLIDDGGAYYCSTNNTIYYGNRFTSDYTDIVRYFVLSHEDGHSNDTRYLDWPRTVFDREQFADCYGGLVMERIYERQYIDLVDLQLLYDFISGLPSNDHGTPQQRYAAFAHGYLYGDCLIY